MQQGRRTASLKASYEAIGGVHSHDFAIGREIAGAAQTALAAIHDIPKKKKCVLGYTYNTWAQSVFVL